MAIMMRGKQIGGLRAIDRAIRDDMVDQRACGITPRPVYLLRADGDTDIYTMTKAGRIIKSREPGHITLGMWIDGYDLPCIVS